ncbi:MAG: YitT family protein [Ignavibacteria bacterium]
MIKSIMYSAVGIVSAAFGLKGFLLPNNFIDGGATGIALLLTTIFDLPLPLLIILVNIPFILMGSKVIGMQFAIRTTIAIITLALVLVFVEFPIITNDKLLVAIFGGFFLGAGIGLNVRGQAVIDGTEVMAIMFSRKLKTTIGDIILITNIIIFGICAYILSIETALYSMVTYMVASRSLDYISVGIDEYLGVTIISDKCMVIKDMITESFGRGVTIYRGKGGYGKRGHIEDKDILYSVITRFEISKISQEIENIDPFAFVVMSPVKDTIGGMIKKRHI